MSQYIDARSKVFAHLDTLHAIKEYEHDPAGKTRPAPINVEIDVSNRCSRGCVFCHFAYTHTKGPLKGKRDKPQDAILGGDLMDYDLAIRLFDQLESYGVKSVTFTGGGEPTLHPRFDEIVNYAASTGLELGLYTLGGHIDRERAELLKEKLTWLYISLDECTPEGYSRIKGVGHKGYEDVIDGIQRLVQAQGNATIGVGFLIHQDNWKEIFNMVHLGHNLGVDYVQFRPTVHYSNNEPGKPLEEDTAWIHHAIGRLNAYKNNSFVVADVDRFLDYANWHGHGYERCWWSALQTVITPNGKIWRCTNKREFPDGYLGDLNEEGFEAIWQRSGGSCVVNDKCRVFCRGHLGNQTLTHVMGEYPHANFP